MKVRCLLITALFCLVLTACATAPVTDSQNTSASATVPAVTESNTGVATTDPTVTEPVDTQPAEFQPQGTPVGEDTLAELLELFSDPKGWYSRILTSYFEEPEAINLRELFYCGIPGVDNQLQEDELAYLDGVWSEEFEFRLDIDRLPAGQMDEILQEYLGISFEDTLGNGLDSMTYWADGDCYYLAHGDTNVIQVLVHSAYVQADGTIDLYYCNGNFDADAAAVPERVAVLQSDDGGYRIVSNQPVTASNG